MSKYTPGPTQAVNMVPDNIRFC